MNTCSKILLLSPPTISHRTAEENLGLGYLAAILRSQKYNVQIIDCWLQDISLNDMKGLLINEKQELLYVGISCYRSGMDSTVELAKLIKSIFPTIKIVIGGYGPTFYANDFLNSPFIDIVVRGEGELIVLDLTKAISEGKSWGNIQGISYKNQGRIVHNDVKRSIEDIDKLPFPHRDTINEIIRRKSTVNILSSRGCFASCLFCSIIAFQKVSKSIKWKQRSIKNFVDEIEFLNSRYGIKHFKVIDDSLIEPPRDGEWCRMLYEEIYKRKIKVYFRGSIRADRVTDEIIYYLKKAGFCSFSCGIENGSASALKRMGKKASIENNRMALSVFKKHNMMIQAGMILFDDQTTYDELCENYEFFKENDWIITKGIFTEMYAAQGTPYLAKLQRSGNIKVEETLKNGNTSYDIKEETVAKIYSGLKQWHKSHSFVYDMVIDPISAPKALHFNEMKPYYDLYLSLREKDIEYFKLILEISPRLTHKEIIAITQRHIDSLQEFYSNLLIKCEQLYKENKFEYTAQINPFIC